MSDMSKGYSMLSKELMDSEDYFSERFTRMQAYMDLCLLAAWKDRKFMKRGQVVELKAGQLAKSEEELADRWKWSRNTVRKYLNEQQIIGNIEQQKSRLITIITVKFGLNIAQHIEQQTQSKTAQQIEQQQEDIYKDNKDIKEEESNDSKKKEPVTDLEKDFEAFRRKYKEYGGSARGFSTEFDNLKKKHKDWKDVIPMLAFALENENKAREDAKRIGDFFPQMKNLQTYINQRSWEAYSDGYENYDPDAYHPDGFPYDAEFDAYRFCDYIPNHDLLDGYTDDNRPDGARIVEQITVWVWSREQRRWNKELKK